jgi:hypothetical protein
MRACEKPRELFGVYVLGQASPEETALLESHLASCADCREEISAQQQIIAQLQPQRPEAEARTRIIAGLKSAQNTALISHRSGPGGSWLARAVWGSALAGGIFVAGLWLGSMHAPVQEKVRVVQVKVPVKIPVKIIIHDQAPAPRIALVKSETPSTKSHRHRSLATQKRIRAPEPTLANTSANTMIATRLDRVIAPVPMGVDDASLAVVEEWRK